MRGISWAEAAPTLFNALLAFYPLAKLVGANPQLAVLSADQDILVLGALGAAAFLALELARRFTGSHRLVVAVHLGVFLSFFWNVLESSLRYSNFIILAQFLTAWATVLAMVWRLMRSPKWLRVTVWALSCAALLPWVQTAKAFASRPQSPSVSEAAAVPQALGAHRPNVYLLVMDTMCSLDYFLDGMDSSPSARADVSEFLDSMSELGFLHLPQAWSSYGRTVPSMPSFFHLDHFPSEPAARNKLFAALRYGFMGSRMAALLRRSGYRVGSWARGGACPDGLDFCYAGGPQTVDALGSLLQQTPLINVSNKLEKYIFSPLGLSWGRRAAAFISTTKLQQIDGFIDYLQQQTLPGHSRFLYAHFNAAHPVNYYDARCTTEEVVPTGQAPGGHRSSFFSRSRYAAEYRCMLRKTVELAAAVRSADPQGQVIILSDHGVGPQEYGTESRHPWDRRRLDSTFRVLAFARLDELCRKEFSNALTHVNKARALARCLAPHEKHPGLSDRLSSDGLLLNGEFILNPDGGYRPL